jgi:hypothetical protein
VPAIADRTVTDRKDSYSGRVRLIGSTRAIRTLAEVGSIAWPPVPSGRARFQHRSGRQVELANQSEAGYAVP